MDTILDISKNVRKTNIWTKFKSYYGAWLDGLYQSRCKTEHEVETDCICDMADSGRRRMKEVAKEHCLLKEEGCKNYCLKYCDHFAESDEVFYPRCPRREPEDGEELLTSNKNIERFLDNFLAGKNCLA